MIYSNRDANQTPLAGIGTLAYPDIIVGSLHLIKPALGRAESDRH
jgi:hypothetical protein